MKRWLGTTLGASVLTLLLGCSEGERPAAVSGMVLIDGKPLAEGEIIFAAKDGSKTPAAGVIKNGQYTLAVLPGEKIVRITASRPTKIPDPVMGAAAREAMIGAKYNTKSTLTAEVKPGANENLNFEVKALP